MSTTFPDTDGRTALGVLRRPISPLLLALLIALPLALLISWSMAVTIWQTGSFFDTDDAMRAVQVRDWMAGQGWFDLAAHRFGLPEGQITHWSRVVDVPLALLARAFGTALSPDMAERAARIAWPLALQMSLIAAMAYAARVLAGSGAMLPAAMLIVFGGICYTQFQPGRIDHEALQIVLLTLMTGTLLESLDPAKAPRAALTGIAVAVSLAVSLENLPFVAVVLGALPVAWTIAGDRHRGALLWLALGLGLAAPAMFVATVAPERYAISSVDAFSAPHVAGAVMGSATLVLLAVLTPFCGTGGLVSLGRRAALLAALGAAVAATMLWAFPGCLQGPFAGMDPLVKHLWLDKVREVQPMLAALQERPGTTLALIGPMVVGSICALVALAATRGVARLRWAVLAALVLAGFVGTLWGIRVAFSLQPLALLGGAWAAYRSLVWARGSRRRSVATIVPFVLFLACSTLGWALLPFGSASTREDAKAAADLRCYSASALEPLDRLPPGRVFAPLDAGPFLLAHTSLSVLAGPFHRNDAGNLAVLKGFTAPPDAARAIVRDTDARYVVVCPNSAPPPAGAAVPDDLATALEAGRVPAWLKPVPLDGTPYRVYAVE